MALPAFTLSECVLTHAIDTESGSGVEKIPQEKMARTKGKQQA